MDYVPLGRSGLKVSQVCLGTNMIGDYVDLPASDRMVNAFLDAGGNFLDTSNSYSKTKSEEFLGELLRGRKRHDVVLATKVATQVGQTPHDGGGSRKHILDSVEQSLKRLQTDYLDLYQMHRWDDSVPIEETMRTLDDLVRQGKVRYIGCSNYAAWQICKAMWVSERLGLERFVSAQPSYSFLSRAIEREVVPVCQDQGIGIIPYQVLMSGMVTGRYKPGQEPPKGSRMAERERTRTRAFNERNFRAAQQVLDLAKKYAIDPVQLTIAWALHKPGITSVIAGASKPEQVRSNLEAASIRLSPEQVKELDAVGS
ncbi:MAG: aldo/keto reductase [Pseudomonadota bacterium]